MKNFASRTNWLLEPNEFAQALAECRSNSKPLFDLTASNPTACGFAYPEREILAALADPAALAYRPESKGLRETRAAIADYYRGKRGFDGAGAVGDPERDHSGVDPERVVVSSGTSEAYSNVLRLLCDAGDEILVPAPSYPLFEFLADLADVRLARYPLVYDRSWTIDLAELLAASTPRTRAVVVVHPNNPTGSFVKREEAVELQRICAANGMVIVADEVFLDYGDSRSGAATFAFSGEVLTFTMSGLSKICALPQMKIAWTVVSGPEGAVKEALERLDVIADTYLSASTPTQVAAPKLLTVRDRMQEQIRARISANLKHLDAAIARSAVKRLEREGGWYAVLRLPGAMSAERLSIELLEQCRVAVHPGHFFDFTEEGIFVVSLITAETEFQEGVRRLLGFCDEQAAGT